MTARSSRLGERDLYFFNEGTHSRLFEKLGAHPGRRGGESGSWFAVWAPSAGRVSVIGDFNDWKADEHPLEPRAGSGIFEGFVPGARVGQRYKYRIESRDGRYGADKADPFAFRAELPPATASLIWRLDHAWGDAAWQAGRAGRHDPHRPISIYEVHLGSWRRGESDRLLGYREVAEPLADYCRDLGFTHVELMPLMEHPFYGSWGYQVTGYFAPTARYGTPQDLMFLVDHLHRSGIGVILDWVPSHFPTDEHGLGFFDGTHLYEHADPRRGFHPDWNSFIFNYGRHEVRSFLLSSARYWLEVFHADALRVDAVASMLYLDYSRKPGEWVPNREGGREDLDAIAFLRALNRDVRAAPLDAETFAEESTAWPMVSGPIESGGLGFGYKWDMGWMHDMLQYMSRDPIHRSQHHRELNFRAMYAFSEKFVLPLSHDEVVHGKGSLLGKMHGDEWQKFAHLRLLLGAMWTTPAKKLLFMGGEIGQWREWDHDTSLDWHLLERAPHAGLQRWVRDLNRLYREEPALHTLDCEGAGFAWVDCDDVTHSTLAWLRRARPEEVLLVVCNFTPVPRHDWRLGVPRAGRWSEILNGDAQVYGGSGQGNLGGVRSWPVASHGYLQSIVATLPPLAMVVFKPSEGARRAPRPGEGEQEERPRGSPAPGGARPRAPLSRGRPGRGSGLLRAAPRRLDWRPGGP